MSPFDYVYHGEVPIQRIAADTASVLVTQFVADNVRDAAAESPSSKLFLLTDEPSDYHNHIWPDNVWLGVRACTNDKVDLLAARTASLTPNVWLSCTPRDPIVVPKSVRWVFCNADECGPMYPAMVRQLRDSAVAQAVPFWFQSWDGWVETFMNREPLVCSGDSVVRRDGVVVGHVDMVDRRDNGTIREMSAKRIPDPSGSRLRAPMGSRPGTVGPAAPKYRLNRALGPEIYMRKIGNNPGDDKIDGRMWRGLP